MGAIPLRRRLWTGGSTGSGADRFAAFAVLLGVQRIWRHADQRAAGALVSVEVPPLNTGTALRDVQRMVALVVPVVQALLDWATLHDLTTKGALH